MYAFLVRDERGTVVVDWVALTAGIIVLGMMVAYAVFDDSHLYLVTIFENLNNDLASKAGDIMPPESSADSTEVAASAL